MSKCKITNIEKTEKIDEWGILQINNLKDTFFRFDLIDGKPQLDTSLFVNKEGEILEKGLSEQSQLYKDVLCALNEYYRNVPVIVFKNKIGMTVIWLLQWMKVIGMMKTWTSPSITYNQDSCCGDRIYKLLQITLM
ncbi:hypothetical protein [Alkalicoccobacillus gibsonii]|uniref:hypothetical protein n=1 Tax=Alkalicoccobacillus gibsonii TaxID=79881 RepID=UPI0019331D11|nr:hypothetical protein [Alkalicoccobacillus gibsonii]MBM0064954.1 hypothetical protein [Alkalicoccobacillus gibsonii]